MDAAGQIQRWQAAHVPSVFAKCFYTEAPTPTFSPIVGPN